MKCLGNLRTLLYDQIPDIAYSFMTRLRFRFRHVYVRSCGPDPFLSWSGCLLCNFFSLLSLLFFLFNNLSNYLDQRERKRAKEKGIKTERYVTEKRTERETNIAIQRQTDRERENLTYLGQSPQKESRYPCGSSS